MSKRRHFNSLIRFTTVEIDETAELIIQHPFLIKDIVTADDEIYFRFAGRIMSVNKALSLSNSSESYNAFRYIWDKSVSELVSMSQANEQEVQRLMTPCYGDTPYKHELFKALFELVETTAEECTAPQKLRETNGTYQIEEIAELALKHPALINDIVVTGNGVWTNTNDIWANCNNYQFHFAGYVLSVIKIPSAKSATTYNVLLLYSRHNDKDFERYDKTCYGDTSYKNELFKRLYECVRNRCQELWNAPSPRARTDKTIDSEVPTMEVIPESTRIISPVHGDIPGTTTNNRAAQIILRTPEGIKEIVRRDDEYYFRFGESVFSVNKVSSDTIDEMYNVFRHTDCDKDSSIEEVVEKYKASQSYELNNLSAHYGGNEYVNELYKRLYDVVKSKAIE